MRKWSTLNRIINFQVLELHAMSRPILPNLNYRSLLSGWSRRPSAKLSTANTTNQPTVTNYHYYIYIEFMFVQLPVTLEFRMSANEGRKPWIHITTWWLEGWFIRFPSNHVPKHTSHIKFSTSDQFNWLTWSNAEKSLLRSKSRSTPDFSVPRPAER